MQTGIIKFFATQRGFGFITPTNADGDVFFHLSNIEGNWHPADGMYVEYEVGTSPRNGKREALTVKLLPQAEAEKEKAWSSKPVTPESVPYE